MLTIPRIALYRPHDDEARGILQLFPRDIYSVRAVDSPAHILAYITEESAAFDAILVPPRTRDNDGGAAFIQQVRAEAALHGTPVVALCAEPEPHLVAALYDSGAEAVILPPFDLDLILSQVRALHRLRSSLERERDYAYELSGLRTSTTKALNCVREGILLFSPTHELTFMNPAAGRFLGIRWDTPPERIHTLTQQFTSLIHAHSSATQDPGQDDSASPISMAETTIQRLSGEQAKVFVRILSLPHHTGELIGYTVALTDISEFATLAAQVQQSQRTRSLCVLAAAGCIQLARGGDPVRAKSAADLFDKVVLRDAQRCSLSNVMTVFLETLDLIAPPAVKVRVKLDRDLALAVRPAELFQVIGHLVLEGIDFCGERGEIEIVAAELPEMGSVRLSIAAESQRSIPLAPSDCFSSLLQGSMSLADSDAGSPHPYGIAAVRQILKNYESTPVSEERPGEKSLLLRVMLPLVE
jgi:DNA-binding response OmpR family regulator